jgi:hypothetical protein
VEISAVTLLAAVGSVNEVCKIRAMKMIVILIMLSILSFLPAQNKTKKEIQPLKGSAP